MDYKFYKNDHHQQWSSMLRQIYRQQLHTDITLVCEGKKIHVHRSILAALSPFFKRLLSDCDISKPVITMENFRFSTMLQLVKFLYQGSIQGSAEDLISVSAYAKDLCIEGLINANSHSNCSRVELKETKVAVQLQLSKLKNFTNSESDASNCSSSDESDPEIVYEKSVKQLSKPVICQKFGSNGKEQLRTETQSRFPLKRSTSSFLEQPLKKKTFLPDSRGNISAGLSTAIKCSVCRQIFGTRAELEIHRQTHADLLTCGICNKLYASRSGLKRHLRNHIRQIDCMIANSNNLSQKTSEEDPGISVA